jgi:hypothetical protein
MKTMTYDWKQDENGFTAEGFAVELLAVWSNDSDDPFAFPFHAEVWADVDMSDLVYSGGFLTIDAAKLWCESVDLQCVVTELQYSSLNDEASHSTQPTCACGCSAPWTATDTDEYLDTHFECEGCGDDYPMDDDLVVERWTTHEGTVVVYFCKSCSEDK